MEFNLILTVDDILALDEYFTHRVGYIGHDGTSDLAAHQLANEISRVADELRTQRELEHDAESATID